MVRQLALWTCVSAALLVSGTALHAVLPGPADIRSYLEADDPAAPVAPFGFLGMNSLAREVQCPHPGCRYTTYAYQFLGLIPCPDPWGVHAAEGGAIPALVPVAIRDRFLRPYDDDGPNTWAVDPDLGVDLPLRYARPFHPPVTGGPPGQHRVHFAMSGLRVAAPVRVRIVPPGVRKPSALGILWDDAANAEASTTLDRHFWVPPALVSMVPQSAPGTPTDNDADGWPDYPILANPGTARTQIWTITFHDSGAWDDAPVAPATISPPAALRFALWHGTYTDGAPNQGNLASRMPLARVVDAIAGTDFRSSAVYPGLWVATSEEIAFAFNPTPDPGTGQPPIFGYGADRMHFRTYSNCVYYPTVASAGTGDQNPSVQTPASGRLDDSGFVTGGLGHPLARDQVGVGRVELQENVLLPRQDRAWRPYDVDPERLMGGTDPNGVWGDFDLVLDAAGGAADGNPPYTDKSLFCQFMSSRVAVPITGAEYDDPTTPGDETAGPPVVRQPLVVTPGPPEVPGGPPVPAAQVPPGADSAASPFALDNRMAGETVRCPTCGARHQLPNDPNGYPHAAGGSICEYDGTPLTYVANAGSGTADVSFVAYETMSSGVPCFSRSSLDYTGAARIPFRNVLFAPVTPTLPAAALGAVTTVSVKVPNYQPPSLSADGDAAPYLGVMLAVQRADLQNRWYAASGGVHANFTGPPAAAGPDDVLYDNNDQWDAYYECPDCGNKQADPGPCLYPACPGHVIDRVFLCLLPPDIAFSPFYAEVFGGAPDRVSTVNPGGPPGLIGGADVSAEEFDPFRVQTSVAARIVPLLAHRTIHAGKVEPGAVGPVAPEDPLLADVFPKAISRAAAIPLTNEGNVPLSGLGYSVSPLVRAEVSGQASVARVRQGAAISDAIMEGVDYLDGSALVAGVGILPPLPDDEAGSPDVYLPTGPGTGLPGPTRMRVGSAASAPVPSGTPSGEYAGVFRVSGRAAPVRVRITESRAPASVNGLGTNESGPAPYFEPTGELSFLYSSNVGGAGAPNDAQNIIAATTAPLTAGLPGDPFFRGHDLSAAVISNLSGAAGVNQFHVEPHCFVDDPWGPPTTAWAYWHARVLNTSTGLWNRFLGFYNPGTGPGLLVDSRHAKGGVNGIIPREGANLDAGGTEMLQWLFWHGGPEGREQTGFTPRFTPTDLATMSDHWLHLSNARMGSSDPHIVTYRDYSGTPSALNGLQIRKPDSNPFVYTKDPWVFEFPDNRPLLGGVFDEEDHLLNVFYSAFLRRQGQSDICWSMFDLYAGAGGPPIVTRPADNYGKRAFPAVTGELLRPDGALQVFESRHLDWVISPGFPSTSSAFDPVLTVDGVPVAWSGANTGGNYYDERTGIIHMTPTNLPPDPVTGGPLRIEIDPSAGVVAFSRSLLTVYGAAPPVTLDYQFFTFRVTRDGNSDDSPAAFFDAFNRLVVFWRRSHSVSDQPLAGRTSFMYKTFATSIQVLRPPMSAFTGASTAPTVVDAPNGVLWYAPGALTPPFAVTVNYDDPGGNARTETHQVVGWGKERAVPLDVAVAEGPLSVAQEMYLMPNGMTGVKYWLFWTSNRDYYAPSGGAMAPGGRSDAYYTVVTPTFDTDVPEPSTGSP